MKYHFAHIVRAHALHERHHMPEAHHIILFGFYPWLSFGPHSNTTYYDIYEPIPLYIGMILFILGLIPYGFVFEFLPKSLIPIRCCLSLYSHDPPYV